MAITAVPSAATSTALLANDPYRKSFVMENSDANRLYVLLDSGAASSSNYSFSLAQYESVQIDGYKGEIYGIWASDGSGHAMITPIA